MKGGPRRWAMDSGPLPVKAYGDDLRNLEGIGRRDNGRRRVRRWLFQLKPVELLRVRILIVRGDPSLLVRALRGKMCVNDETPVMIVVLLVHMEERSLRQSQQQRHTQLGCENDPHGIAVQPSRSIHSRERQTGIATRHWVPNSGLLSILICPLWA
jgi:hypothetical protein